MGVSLYPITNHNIDFKGRKFDEIVEDILLELNLESLPDTDFLKEHIELWNNDEPERIKEILEVKHWSNYKENDIFKFEDYPEIEFYGPYDLSLMFFPNKLYICDPPYRYSIWFNLKDENFRNGWRKYIYHITKLFGGDRVIYLPDSIYKPAKYALIDDGFDEIEKALLKEFGKPITSFEKFDVDKKNAYFIDYFEDLK